MLPQDLRLIEAKRCGLAVGARDADPGELVRLHDAETNARFILNLLLEFLGKLLVTFGSDDGQRVDLETTQPAAILVHAEAQTASDGLAAFTLAPDNAESADLEHIRVVPAIFQRGVREDNLELRLE